MANRIQRKVKEIEAGLVETDDSYLNAEHALANWGLWNKSIKNPAPLANAKTSSLFMQIAPDYPDEDEGRKDPNIEEAELTEQLILLRCSRRDMDIFTAVYVMDMNKDETLLYLRKRSHKHAHQNNYRRFLDAGLSKLSAVIDERWNIPSMTVIPNRGQSDTAIERERHSQVLALKRRA